MEMYIYTGYEVIFTDAKLKTIMYINRCSIIKLTTTSDCH